MIIQHPTHRGYGDEPSQVIQCDFCAKLAPSGYDMHAAVERARSAKFSTVSGGTVLDPRKWSCPGCTAKRTA